MTSAVFAPKAAGSPRARGAKTCPTHEALPFRPAGVGQPVSPKTSVHTAAATSARTSGSGLRSEYLGPEEK